MSLAQLLESKWKVFLILILFGLIAHGVDLGGTFTSMDDEASIVFNDQIKSFSNLPSVFTNSFFGGSSYYRPIVNVSFMLEYQLFELRPLFYHLTNVLLHILNAALVFLLIGLLSKDKMAAFFTSILFVIHPVHWEAVANIPGRAVLLCASFYLIAFYYYARFKEKPKKKPLLVISLVAFTLSLLSKEEAVTFPVMIALFVMLSASKNSWSGKIRKMFKAMLPYGIITVIYLMIRQALTITKVFTWNSLQEVGLGFITFLRSFLSYLRILILPTDLHYDRSRVYFTEFGQAELLFTLVCVLVLILIIIRYWKKVDTAMKLFIIWPVCAFIPVMQFVPIRAHGNFAATPDHFLYIPSVGLLFVLSVLFNRCLTHYKEKKVLSNLTSRILVDGLLLIFLLTTIQINIISANETLLFKRALKYNPKNTRIRSSYALALAKEKDFTGAEKHFRLILDDEPLDVRARIGLGKSLCDQGQYWKGVQEYEKIRNPGNQKELLKINIRSAYNILIERYQMRIVGEQDNADLYYSLGVMYAKIGQMHKANDQYLKAIFVNPQHNEALFNLANGLQALGQLDEAKHYFDQMTSEKLR